LSLPLASRALHGSLSRSSPRFRPLHLTAALAACCKELVAAHSEISPVEPDALFACLASLLADKRAKTFALKGFDRRALASRSGPSDTQHDALACYIAERAKVDEEMRRLTNLFREMQ
jgi:hypothetical protein